VLVVDDDPTMRHLFKRLVGREGYGHLEAADAESALKLLQDGADPAVALVDLVLPGMQGTDLIAQIARERPEITQLAVSGMDAVPAAVAAVKAGAHDFVRKPFGHAEFSVKLRNAVADAQNRRELKALAARAAVHAAGLIGDSPAMREVYRAIAQVGPTDATVLIQGETGSGKELVARAIHAAGPRARGPLVVVNCAAIPEALVESELFGHARGAFTGAAAARPGRFREAEGGAIFLDEVGDLKADAQAKLLRALQNREVQPVGGRPEKVDVRVIAATHRDLEGEVAKKTFREDLFYRLNVFRIRVPPLRERGEDVVQLASAFIARAAARYARPAHAFSPAAVRALGQRKWRGNVRELENAIERAVLSCEGAEVLPEHLPAPLAEPGPRAPALPVEVVPLETLEKQALEHALDRTSGNVAAAARALGVSREGLYQKLRRHGLKIPGRRR
jgi:DNA-binding NtrC family response regulator